jgi:hypothetical protein
MVPITDITGRLGNQMFEIAFLYAWARDNGMPLVDDGLGYYYQDPKHWEGYEDEIKKLYGSGVTHNDYIGIHIRRGDYVNHPFYVDLMKTDYYEKAMAEFPSERFQIFSDDLNWCTEQPIFKDVWFNKSTELDDFNTMAGCKGFIIANSSFSWWAGYLNKGKVVAPGPKLWHTDGICRTKVPKEWIVIE